MIAHLDQQRAVPEHFWQRSGAAGDDGHAGAHGLEGREPEALVAGGIGQDGRSVEQSGEIPGLDPPGADDPPASR